MRWIKDTLTPALDDLRNMFSLQPEKIGAALARGGMLISSRAVEHIKDKKHVITGTLWRSVHVGFPGDYHGSDFDKAASSVILTTITPFNAAQAKIGPEVYQVEIGSWIWYAYFVEALADGGFIFPAFQERAQQAINYTSREIMALVKELGL